MSQWEALREDAQYIIDQALRAAQPDRAVEKALAETALTEPVTLVAVGKAAWQMSRAALDALGGKVRQGIVITKYGHSRGPLGNLKIFEAGHPVPDENGVRATQAALDMVGQLTDRDTVLFLLSGGGSALFEKPLIPLEELQDINRQLLACGADITQINAIRKRLSAVKGGRFAARCGETRIFCVILSDVLGDQPDMIASGPACADRSTCAQALEIAEKYRLRLSGQARALLERETPKQLPNVTVRVTGSVRQLCAAAQAACRSRGYAATLLTDRLCCQAREAGAFLGAIAQTHAGQGKLAFLAGGETVVRLLGDGKGGRNQELALSAAPYLAGAASALFSIGSDGTDGPTDAAGGYVDGRTLEKLEKAGCNTEQVLDRNDAYTALDAVGGLIRTGPTGTNVNDVAVLLIRPNE